MTTRQRRHLSPRRLPVTRPPACRLCHSRPHYRPHRPDDGPLATALATKAAATAPLSDRRLTLPLVRDGWWGNHIYASWGRPLGRYAFGSGGGIRTRPSAVAVRSVSGFPPTSTMRARRAVNVTQAHSTSASPSPNTASRICGFTLPQAASRASAMRARACSSVEASPRASNARGPGRLVAGPGRRAALPSVSANASSIAVNSPRAHRAAAATRDRYSPARPPSTAASSCSAASYACPTSSPAASAAPINPAAAGTRCSSATGVKGGSSRSWRKAPGRRHRSGGAAAPSPRASGWSAATRRRSTVVRMNRLAAGGSSKSLSSALAASWLDS
jgi:hypothetical protein